MFNCIRQLQQIVPARCKKKLEVRELTKACERFYVEQKIDGERFILHTDKPTKLYRHAITSRTESAVTGRMVEKTDRVPHLTNHQQLPKNSLLDNEFVATGDIVLVDLPGKYWDKLLEPYHSHMIWLKKKFNGALPIYPHVSNTVSILGSLGSLAVQKQKERGIIWAYCFDILMAENKMITKYCQENRRVILRNYLEIINPEIGLILMPAWSNLSVDEIIEFYHIITDYPIRGEGLVLKDFDKTYNQASNWYKLKRDYPADVVLTGKALLGEMGKTGQMSGMASALEIGVYKNGIMYPIGWVSAIMDGMHNLVDYDLAEVTFKGRVIECRHNGLQEDETTPLGVTLRHPRFRRWREDKNAKDCLFENILEETRKTLLE